jgi:hypothetical protein
MKPSHWNAAAAMLAATMMGVCAGAIERVGPDVGCPAVEPAGVPAAIVVTADDVASVVRQLSAEFTDDEPIRVVEAGPNRLGLFVVRRPKATGPTQTEPGGAAKVTEGLQLTQVSAIIRILDGAGTFVTGGRLLNAVRMPANDPDAVVIGPGYRGKAILGGQSRRVSDGDMVVVPAGVPYGFSEFEKPITYLAFRVDAGGPLPLK